MNLRSQADADQLLTDFGGFFDAVVISISVARPRSRADRDAAVRILAEEAGTGASGRWRTVDFRLARVRDYRFEETQKTAHWVLSMGLRMYLEEGIFFLDIAPESEASSLEDVRHSSHYIVGGSCAVELGEAPADW